MHLSFSTAYMMDTTYFLYLTYKETELLAHVATASGSNPVIPILSTLGNYAMWMRWWDPLAALTCECVMVKSVFTSGFQSPTFSLAATILPCEVLFSWSWFPCSVHMFFFISSWLVFYDLGIWRGSFIVNVSHYHRGFCFSEPHNLLKVLVCGFPHILSLTVLAVYANIIDCLQGTDWDIKVSVIV